MKLSRNPLRGYDDVLTNLKNPTEAGVPNHSLGKGCPLW